MSVEQPVGSGLFQETVFLSLLIEIWNWSFVCFTTVHVVVSRWLQVLFSKIIQLTQSACFLESAQSLQEAFSFPRALMCVRFKILWPYGTCVSVEIKTLSCLLWLTLADCELFFSCSSPCVYIHQTHSCLKERPCIGTQQQIFLSNRPKFVKHTLPLVLHHPSLWALKELLMGFY